ncbi:hypothetical protein [Streptomyces sp. SM12]|uniref:hypothetical protein n=1 Tax=Streptomyces sp. SM12 TaxID=1071602 RepID=UPI0015E1601E|nr:hypothetical protein [Streptomyces sp. SM12]
MTGLAATIAPALLADWHDDLTPAEADPEYSTARRMLLRILVPHAYSPDVPETFRGPNW